MMVFKNDSVCGIKTKTDACHILEKLAYIANEYGRVTIADLKEVFGIDSNYTDNKYGWSMNGIRAAKIWSSDSDYMITLFRSLPLDNTETKTKLKPEHECLTINIRTAEVDSPDEVLAEVMKYVHTITDREVIVNIT